MTENSLPTLYMIAQEIYDKKGANIIALDVHGFSSITDYLVIAEGNVDRHVSGIARAVIEKLDKEGMHPLRIEGIKTGDWVVLDYGEVMIHLFKPGLREKYALEKLWLDSKIVEVAIRPEV